MSEWKPIETAPKDGTEIIVCGGTHGCHYMPCEFHNAKLEGSLAAYFDFGSKDWRRSYDMFSNSPGYLLPTHWMNLPEPPSQ